MRRFTLLIKITFTLLLILSIFLFYSTAKIQVSTTFINIEATPGDMYKDTFEVTNTGEKEAQVEIEVLDWEMDKTGEVELYEPGTSKYSLGPWLDFTPAEFSLGPGESRMVSITATIPEDSPGPHWAMVFVKEVAATVKKKGAITVPISVAYGIKVFQVNPGNYLKEGRITQVSTEFSKGSKRLEKIGISFENTGTVPLRPSGYLEIRDQTGDTVDKIEIESFFILPHSERVLSLPYKKDLKPGSYIILAIIDFGGDYLTAGQRLFEIKGQ